MTDFDDIPDLITGEEANLEEKLAQLDTHIAPIAPEKLAEYKETLQTRLSNKPTRKVPITIITGYLGSGKSTLLDLIAKKGGRRIAVILNEFGDTAAIEKSLTIQDSETKYEEWLDLGNGCLCCTVKDTGVTAIETLIEKSHDKIDYILLETSGLADPAPIARMFWLDDAISSNVYIDGVVTVLDSVNITKCLEDVGGHWHKEQGYEVKDGEEHEGITTAHLQIALADVVLLNKIDKITSEEGLKSIKEKIKQINSVAPIHETTYGNVNLDKILDIHAFETSIKLNETSRSHHDSFHDSRISTISLDFEIIASSKFAIVEEFIQFVLWEGQVNGHEIEIHRAKGIIIDNEGSIQVLQAVREAYEFTEVEQTEVKQSKLVFIGKGLDLKELSEFFTEFTGVKVIGEKN